MTVELHPEVPFNFPEACETCPLNVSTPEGHLKACDGSVFTSIDITKMPLVMNRRSVGFCAAKNPNKLLPQNTILSRNRLLKG